MSELLPGSTPPRFTGSPGSLPPYHDGGGRSADSSDRGTDLKQLLMLLRRRMGLVGGVAALTVFGVALFVLLERPLYRATATVRLAYPRRALTVGVEDLPAAKEQGSDPLLSLIELVRGREIVGAVVDSLGLRLQPRGSWFGASSRIVRAALRDVRVNPGAREDTLRLTFYADSIVARGLQRKAAAPYGRPLAVGSVQFTIPFHPGVAAGTLVVRAREEVIDDVLKILAVVRRKSTDIVDVTYSDADPFLAQRVANQLVRVFQARDAGSAQEQARRRAEFLAAQLRATDSAMTVAQAQLSAFRRLRLLGSSGDRLAAAQARLTALDARRGELEAERSVYESFLAKVNTSNDSLRLEASRDLSYTPEPAAAWAALPDAAAGSPPRAKRGLALGLGLLLGCGAAGLGESGNTSITRAEELERALNVRDLRVIPPLLEPSSNGHSRRRHPISFFTPARRRPEADNRLGAEAFRLVYSGLTFGWGEGRRTIRVTSAAPREGKTLIAANLGVTFAREESAFLLLNLACRAPAWHGYLALPPAPVWTNCLRPTGARLPNC